MGVLEHLTTAADTRQVTTSAGTIRSSANTSANSARLLVLLVAAATPTPAFQSGQMVR